MTVQTTVLAASSLEVALTNALGAIHAPEARSVDSLFVDCQRFATSQWFAAQCAAWLAITTKEALAILGLHELAFQPAFA